ncbi:MAG: hypothetical protein GY854_12220 [Deltaproteobacteria bacterium]|nr:hypothetical protein [Deltaproteobacteria bacterium]
MKLLVKISVFIMLGCATGSGKKASVKNPQSHDDTSEIQSSSNENQPISEAEKEFIKHCETANCRRNVRITLRQKDGSLFTYTNPLFPPIVQPGFITLLAGEKVYLEAAADENGPVNFKVVEKIENPEKTITFRLNQNPNMGDGTGMILHVKNPFKRAIRYRLGMMVLESDNVYATSSCPVRAGISVMEMWQHPIFQLIFAEMRFIDEGKDDFSCRE